jgi:ribosomal protein S18 acetylase RimI-like enzyme
MFTPREHIHTSSTVEIFASRQQDNAIRPLKPDDLPCYLAHLLRLGRQCRRSRFGNEVNDRFLHDYVGRVNLANTLVLGYFEDNEMRGAAELRSLQNEWCGEAEVAFSVEEACRSKGLGSRLMARALVEAGMAGVAQVHLICDRHNRAMQCIAEKAGCSMRFEDSDCIATIRIEARREEVMRAAA